MKRANRKLPPEIQALLEENESKLHGQLMIFLRMGYVVNELTVFVGVGECGPLVNFVPKSALEGHEGLDKY